MKKYLPSYFYPFNDDYINLVSERFLSICPLISEKIKILPELTTQTKGIFTFIRKESKMAKSTVDWDLNMSN